MAEGIAESCIFGICPSRISSDSAHESIVALRAAAMSNKEISDREDGGSWDV